MQSHASWGGGWYCASRELRYHEVFDRRRITASVFCCRDLAPVYVSFENTQENIPGRRLDFAIRVEFKALQWSRAGIRCKAKGHPQCRGKIGRASCRERV